MSKTDDLRRALRYEQPVSRRQKRAARTRAWALSPVRILMLLLSFPFLASAVATSLYVRTSPYEPATAVAHLIARGGCDVADYLGLVPAYRGEVGYHALNDLDGNGVACEEGGQITSGPPVEAASLTSAKPAIDQQARMTNGAKFVKP